MAFGRKKKENELHKGDLLVADGIYLKQATMKNGHIVINCFLRALIVFFLVLGSIGGFLSAFEISYNYIMIIGVFMVLSMYFSFLYASSKFIYRDFGYIVFFAIFVAMIYLLRIYANSGFYVIVNTVLERARAFFELPGVRQYEVQINNDYLTVSIVTCFLGMVMIIVLNIWMYSIMSMFWTLLFTFPLLFVPMYMKLSPNPIYMIFLTVGYMAVMIFKANGHYVVFAWDTPFKTRGIIRKRVSYTQDSGIFKQIIGSLLALSFCIVLIATTILSPSAFQGRFKNDRLWNATSEAIGNFILLGFSGMYNRYPSTGGMSGGKLGGVSNVRPDYMTDLTVTFVPYGYDGIYLKGYTGGIYGDNQWLSIYDGTGNYGKEDSEIFADESMKKEVETLMEYKGEYSSSGFMRIHNEGADTAYLYYPYYTRFSDYSIYNNHNLLSSTQGIPYGKEVDYKFYPKIVWEDELMEARPSDIDVSNVNSDYLDVPEKNKAVIDKVCDDMGLNGDMTENQILEEVVEYFQDNYPYTLKPGSTPEDKDFINYFLEKNKKGYCAHFASAATLIFRNMGIPARYVEGYAFSMENVLASDAAEGLKPEDFYEGYTAVGEAPVMKVEVSDAQAHAWVEIYIDGFGWKNVEVTPGSNEEVVEDDFWSAFSQILQGGLNQGNGDARDALAQLNIEQYSWMLYVILSIIVFTIVLVIVRICIRKIRRYILCHQSNLRDAAIARYADVCDMLRLCDSSFDRCRSHAEQLEYIERNYDISMDVANVRNGLERMSFHDEYLDEQEINALYELFKMIKSQIYKNSGMKNKIALIKR